jgi:diguanylate cyclase (GGDEF)-like protein
MLILAPRMHLVTRLLDRFGIWGTTAFFTAVSCALSLVVTLILMVGVFGGMNLVAFVLAVAVPLTCSPVMIVVLLRLAEELQHTRQELHRLSITDDLTQVHNRRYFFGLARREIARVSRYGGQLSIALLDLDGFKELNDRHGHSAGDAALQAVASACRMTMRETDAFARLGGEEFAALLPNTQGRGALEIAERLRTRVAECDIPWQGQRLHVTASVGLAEYGEHCASVERLLHAADEALYTAKRAGKNRTVIARFANGGTIDCELVTP